MNFKNRYISRFKGKTFILVIILSSITFLGSAQVLNDDCRFATALPSSDNYCSADGQFSNVGANVDQEFTNGCVALQWENGVWFSFVPREPAVLIRVFGSGQGGTLRNPKIVLFESCLEYLQCSPGKELGLDELVVSDLSIGQTYFIMVESSIGGEGTFKLCIDDFIPTPSPESDCDEAVILCDKSPFKVASLTSIGNDRNEIEPNNCIAEEFASSWYKWTCDEPGSLTFTLTPNNHRGPNFISDDLDFAVYELPNGIDNCNGKVLLRCMASGANGTGGATDPLPTWISCNGPTGLMIGDPDITEAPGCQPGNNNFVSALNMETGKSYVLIINNFSRSGLGFAIEFGGTGTFLGPKPDFEINANNAFECDKTIQFTNTSVSETDPIVSYNWNFGDRSVPNRAQGFGPYDVLYESFGNKIAALTVESSRGCTVTKIVDFFVDPCCKDTSTLVLNAQVVDLRCFNIPEGQILASGERGSPEYMYSLNGGPFQPNPLFPNLDIGNYTLTVQDIKGCTQFLERIINEPPPIIVDAGIDQEIELGETINLNGSFESFNGVDSLFWTPSADIEINGIEDPVAFPKSTTTYTFTVTDLNGCTEDAMVTIRVIKNYELHAPNIFRPNEDLNNDFFNVWGNRGIKYVELLEVYDRWGNLVYQGKDIRIPDSDGKLIINDENNGWDGTFNGKPMNPGIFAWRALVRFIDDYTMNYAGDLTLVR